MDFLLLVGGVWCVKSSLHGKKEMMNLFLFIGEDPIELVADEGRAADEA